MNLIKNLQKILKAKIIKLYLELVTMKDNDITKRYLIQVVKEVQGLIKEELLNKLTLEIQKRIDILKTVQEQYTKY